MTITDAALTDAALAADYSNAINLAIRDASIPAMGPRWLRELIPMGAEGARKYPGGARVYRAAAARGKRALASLG